MPPKKVLLPINKLEVGMVSAADLYIKNSILLGKGVTITESVLSRLKKVYVIDKVEVYSNSDTPTEQPVKREEELENTLSTFSNTLENIFSILSNQKIPEMEELRIFSQKIKEEFNLTRIVIKNINIFGSGNNNIYRHSVNVAAISFILGKLLGLNEHEISLLTYSAILHDFGKIKLGFKHINNNTNLTSKEYKLFKTHPIIGYDFVKNIPFLDDSVGYGVLMHHERADGSGYPFGIKAQRIHRFAKIIAIADLFDEVCSNKYSKKINGPFEALAVIREESLGKLDFYYSSMFLNHVANFYLGENVLLSNKKTCKVVKVDLKDPSRPILLDENGLIDLKQEKDLFIEKILI